MPGERCSAQCAPAAGLSRGLRTAVLGRSGGRSGYRHQSSTSSWGRPGTARLTPKCWSAVGGNRRTVVDVGGGTGALLAEILRARPSVRGTLVDLPATVARSAETFQTAGVSERVTTVAQSFFDPLPAGADLYLIKNVLGDWPDREATALLRRLRRRRGRRARRCSWRSVARRRQTAFAGTTHDGAGRREITEPDGVPRDGSRGRAGSACHRAATFRTLCRRVPGGLANSSEDRERVTPASGR